MGLVAVLGRNFSKFGGSVNKPLPNIIFVGVALISLPNFSLGGLLLYHCIGAGSGVEFLDRAFPVML